MIRFFLPILTTFVLGTLLLQARAAEKSELEGVWVIVENPGTAKEKVYEQVLFVFSESRFTFFDLRPRGNLARQSTGFKFRVNQKADPHQIDVTKFDADAKKEVVQKGIFRIAKNGIIDWCAGQWGGERPAAFTTDKQFTAFKLKRIANSLEEYQKNLDNARAAAIRKLFEEQKKDKKKPSDK